MQKFIAKDCFNSSKFIAAIINSYAEYFVINIKSKNGDNEVDVDKRKAQKIDSIATLLGNYQCYLEELETLILLMKIDRKKLVSFLKDEVSEERYYKYHYDYYIILLTTSLDICGEIGNVVFDLKITDNCTFYKFAKDKRIINPEISPLVSKLSSLFTSIKKERNKKVHTGVNTLNKFGSIIYWNDLSKYVSVANLERNNKDTEENIITLINETEGRTIEITSTINFFFDAMLSQIKPLTEPIS